MKGITKNKNKRVLLSLFGLALLLLISPCNIRNYIQAELDIPLTKVLNKSQTTLSSSNCTVFEHTQNTLISTNSSVPYLAVLDTDYAKNALHSIVAGEQTTVYSTGNYPTSLPPLYILYQNFKAYL